MPGTSTALSDHEIYELLRLKDDYAWRLAFEHAVRKEALCSRSAEMVRKWGIDTCELLGMLFEEMIGKGRIELYRDDGGSLWGWMRRYVRGYILRANPARRGEISLDAEGPWEDGDGDGRPFSEKIAMALSESSGGNALVGEDPELRRREEWDVVQECFGRLWRQNPMRAYVHLLKLRLNLSSTEIKDMLGVSSEANVDQMFSRAARDMRKLRDDYE